MSSSESGSMKSDTEYPDHVHECLKYVPIHRRGAFSCSSPDDEDDDDEDVKRILAEHGGPETRGGEAAGFSSAYVQAARAAAAEKGLPAAAAAAADYRDWDEAAGHASAVYPPLGIGIRAAGRERRGEGRTPARESRDRSSAAAADDDDDDEGRGPDECGGSAGARELRKRLEGALYGGDAEEFAVAQPYCVANKNLDFGKPATSQRAVRESKKKVEIWMDKYAGDEKAAHHY